MWTPRAATPYDFISALIEVRQAIWPRAVAELAAEDSYVAALVAQHALTVYRRYQHDPAWRPFFPRMEALRDDLVAASAPPGLTSFLQDYTIVGLGDLFSLIFCNGWPEPYLMEGYRAILTGDRSDDLAGSVCGPGRAARSAGTARAEAALHLRRGLSEHARRRTSRHADRDGPRRAPRRHARVAS